MKFDVILGNPPYQDKTGNENSTNSSDLYSRFIEKSLNLSKNYVAMVAPSAWSGARNSRLKELLFEAHQCSHFNTHGKRWFDVDMNTCWFMTQVNRQGTTQVSDAFGNMCIMQLSKKSIIIKDLSNQTIVEKLKCHADVSNLGTRWIRGKLNLNQATKLHRGSVPFIRAVGTKSADLDIQMIPKNQESCGEGLHKLVLPNVSSSDALGNIKLASPEMVGGHSVVFIKGDSHMEVKKLRKYLESKLVKFMVRNIKISTPNSKQLFELIPDMPVNWKSDADLYSHFGLSQSDIVMIEKSVDNT